ncbi:grpE protein homolog 2, mitochondrial isoform X1 [Ipomoea triloba]|uniref:grpE protein homolog 2, mitochondrial isoform X1 n=1 Tax=Ipomoea triloba TaxID=35885 RepID=UPI00125E510F|nr:grpE protein homolog 2, mitochondrial isoform X1 [Ipomoea triloba]
MVVSRITSRVSRTVLTQCRNSLIFHARQHQQQSPILSNRFHSLCYPQNKIIPGHVSLLRDSTLNHSAFQRFGMSSSASTQSDEKETAQARNGQGNAVESDAAASANGNAEVPDETNKSGSDMGPNTNTSENIKRRRRSTKQTLFSDSDSDLDVEDLSRDDLVKLIVEKEEKLNAKQKELEEMKDKALRTYAEMENTMDRNRRESENTKKFAVQNFAKSLLDVADNLGRASSVVKESFSKIDTANDNTGAVPLLKTLLEGVEMTEKQLAEVFKKFGVTKYDPINEEFDPNKHNAVFQVPDPSKPPGTVAIVLKSGYMLHDRIIRPAEVGVTQAVEN